MNYDQTIENIKRAALHCADPDKLREWAEMLTKRSAYKEAMHLENRAREIERAYAELAGKK